MTRRLLALPALLTLVALPVAPAYAGNGCFTEAAATEAAATTIVIEHACFGPEAARVAVGATVTWRNDSGLHHNVSGPGIDLADLPAGATHTATFNAPGLYPYACMLHPGMSGVVVVGAAPPTAATRTTGGGPNVAGWALGGVVVLAASGAVLVTVARRPRPVPA